MLIKIGLKIKLLVVEFLFFVRRDEKFRDIIFSEQGTTKYSHDLHDGTPKFEVMLNDSDKTVCDDGNVNLNAPALSLSPQKNLTLRCYLIHLKNSSTCHLYL